MKAKGVWHARCQRTGLCLLAVFSVAGTPVWATSGDYDDLIEGNVLVGLMAKEELNLLPPGALHRESRGAAITGNLVVFGPVGGELGGTVNIEYALIAGRIGVGPGAKLVVRGKKFAVDGGGKLDDPTNPTSVSFSDGPGTLSVTYENGASTELDFYYTSETIYLGDNEPEEQKIDVDIDIKPGSDLNPINPRMNGVVPVAVFSKGPFDATQIDPITVRLSGASVATRGKNGKLMSRPEDVNGDGIMDLMLQIEMPPDGEGWQKSELELTGTTFEGQEVIGVDDIIIIAPPN